jgi:hypothetical protein
MSKNTVIEAEKQKKQFGIMKAKACSDSLVNATLSVQALHDYDVDVEVLMNNFNYQVDKMLQGDVRRPEIMLATQAQTLDALFHKMLQRAADNQVLPYIQGYMDIAFKAQKQCRQTLSALVEIRHPKRSTFIKQQNNAVNQQVNNNIKQKHSKKYKNHTNELLKESRNESVDTRTTITPVTTYSSVEAVGKRGGEDRGR